MNDDVSRRKTSWYRKLFSSLLLKHKSRSSFAAITLTITVLCQSVYTVQSFTVKFQLNDVITLVLYWCDSTTQSSRCSIYYVGMWHKEAFQEFAEDGPSLVTNFPSSPWLDNGKRKGRKEERTYVAPGLACGKLSTNQLTWFVIPCRQLVSALVRSLSLVVQK